MTERPKRSAPSPKAAAEPLPEGTAAESAAASPSLEWKRTRIAVGAALAVVFAWSYWPTLVNLVSTWDREPDYSHGFFVAPLAIVFLWARRDRFPGAMDGLAWPGLGLIVLGVLVRAVGAFWYVDALDGWSIIVWLAGVVWVFGGWRLLWWSLPSVAFLWFAVPLPYRVEHGLSLPLQRIATKLSCWVMQFLGLPAWAKGTTIVINEYQMGIEQACSGLRIFVGILALAFAYVVIVRRPWWLKGLLLLSALPVALVANATRIVVTGVLHQWVSGEAADKFTHDVAGYVMIPFAAGLFALVLLYLSAAVKEVELVGVGEVARRHRE